jgi:mycoredoxin
MKKLQLFSLNMCPHCRAAIHWLEEHRIPFDYREVEEQSPEILQKIIDVNGGGDWVVPTLEYNGKWIPGEVFRPARFEKHLKELGVIN